VIVSVNIDLILRLYSLIGVTDVCVCVSDAELLMRLIKDIGIASKLLSLIDQMLQRPNVTQVSLACLHSSSFL